MSSHSDPDLSLATPKLARVKFRGAVLVCGDCEKRSSGPKKLRAKDLRKDLKRQLGPARHQLRIVQTSCLGLCPKKAIALAALAPEQSAIAAEVKTQAEAAAFAAAVAAAVARSAS